MTNLQALQTECKPYSADDLDCEKTLLDVGKRLGVDSLNPADDYNYDNAFFIAKAAIMILSKYLSLTGETEGQWGQNYDKAGLTQRIKTLCKIHNIDQGEFVETTTLRDGSKMF